MAHEGKEISKRLFRQAGGLFRRGDVDDRDRELVTKWIEEFVRRCEEDSSDESG